MADDCTCSCRCCSPMYADWPNLIFESQEAYEEWKRLADESEAKRKAEERVGRALYEASLMFPPTAPPAQMTLEALYGPSTE